MTQSEGLGGSSSSGTFKKLGEILRDPKHRKEFWVNPHDALSKHGINANEIPAGVRDTLHDLSYEELRVLARVNASLDDAGVSPQDRAEIV